MLDQLKTAEIASRAGLTTGAFFNRWPSRDEFLDEFLDFALSIDRYPGPTQLFEVFAESAGLPLGDLVERLVAVNVAELESSPTLYVQVHLWSLSGQRPDVADRLRRLNVELRDRMVPFYDAVLASLGREYRHPFDGPSVSSLLNALTMGFVEQRVVGGEDAPSLTVLTSAILGWIPVVSRSGDDLRTVEEVVDSALLEGAPS